VASLARSARPPASMLPASMLPASMLPALLLAALLALPGAALAAYEDGQKIQLTGLVTDTSGRPIPELQVVLEASRSYFDIRHLARDQKDVTRLSGITNERGEYSLEWPWNRYYNRFELLVGIEVRRADGDHLKVLERIDLTQKIKRGSPVVSAMVVKDASYVASLRAFLATIKTEDQRRVHLEMGQPDKIEQVEAPDHLESAWWYFEAGKLYRFRDGRLERIEPFAPVKSL
jgi:hypothetical protein